MENLDKYKKILTLVQASVMSQASEFFSDLFRSRTGLCIFTKEKREWHRLERLTFAP